MSEDESLNRIRQGVERLNATFDRIEAKQKEAFAYQTEMVRRSVAINSVLIVLILLLVLVSILSFYKHY